ncbi:MAG: ATP-dependent helicase C-terminal domain-containing protein [Elusimicrobiota bacterium]
MKDSAPLPITPFRDRILQALKKTGSLILTAPTGSGKSTQVPKFLFESGRDFPGTILVLQPRRLAARALASRVAHETGKRLGREIGYKVRFDSRCDRHTSVVFQTYGVFIQQLMQDPSVKKAGVVILDEFHERTLECDLALAWLKAVRDKVRPDLKMAVMSATLDVGGLSRYLPGSEHVHVPGRPFPVDIRQMPPLNREGLAENALRALRLLRQEGLSGAALVFMPGMREIRRTVSALGPFCGEAGFALQQLHGSMGLELQNRIMEFPADKPRVIVSTNVAETSLTIPGVNAVIDSGWHRIAGYSPARDINTLYLARISRWNATQRAGRAGRTAPGRCLRLWSEAEDLSMHDSVAPEVARLELSSLRLKAAFLPHGLDWPTPPKKEALDAAGRTLESIKALDGKGRITAKGRTLVRYPVAPRLASVLEGAESLVREDYEEACAMVAALESSTDRRKDRTVDLRAAAERLSAGDDEDLPWEASALFRQLKRLGADERHAVRRKPGESGLGELWLEAFADRLAARQAESLVYRLADGRKALLPVEKGRTPPSLILAMDIRETAGAGQARQVAVTIHLPCEPEAVQRRFPDECLWKHVVEFDGKRMAVVKEKRLMFRSLAIVSKPAEMGRPDRQAAAALWAEKLASGEVTHASRDKNVEQLVTRIRLAHKFYPEYGYSKLDQDDWRLIYEGVCAGRNTLREIEQVSLTAHIGRYLGAQAMDFLDKTLPTRRKLPSGRMGKLAYFEKQPAELSAKIGDLLGMSGALSLCEGRLPVLFDILAPNFRTVQKTLDLTEFWKNAYPALKVELRRRYPKHPWP